MIRTLGLLASLLAVTTAVLVACGNDKPPKPGSTTVVKFDPDATECYGDFYVRYDPCPTGVQYVTQTVTITPTP